MLLLGLVASSTVEGDKNVSEKSRLVLEERVALQASQMALQASQMERMYAKILELEKRDAARTAEIDQLKATGRGALVPFNSERRRRTQASDSECLDADGVKDPHLHFARGGRADFRGRNGRGRTVLGMIRAAHTHALSLPATARRTASILRRALRSTSR